MFQNEQNQFSFVKDDGQDESNYKQIPDFSSDRKKKRHQTVCIM